jgi:hypothetical protein
MSIWSTIDKITFKVNIPIIITIITGTCLIYGMFASVKTSIALLAQKQDDHAKEEAVMVASINTIKEDNKSQDKQIAEIDRRVYVLEKYK